MNSTRVLLLGATGLVGTECLRELLADPQISEVKVIARHPVALPPMPKLDVHVVDFEQLESEQDAFGVDAIICALGTTMKLAGTRERFRRVDHDYPLWAAQLGRAHGARHFLLVSALGADRESRFFYTRVKGEIEDDLRSVGYPMLTILRPSLILGHRREKRIGESIAKRVALLIPGRLRPVHAREVAAVLVREAKRTDPGMRILESEQIRSQ